MSEHTLIPPEDEDAPMWDIDATDEPDLEEEVGERGGAVVLEGVTIPQDLLEFGNGTLPDTALQLIGVSRQRLHPIAADGFAQLRGAALAVGIDLSVSDAYRDMPTQIKLKQIKPDFSATPGRSVHGWGFAIDVAVVSAVKPVDALSYKQFLWLQKNAPTLGWFGSRPKDEPWHWVYRGLDGSGKHPSGRVATVTSAPQKPKPTTATAATDRPPVKVVELRLASTGRDVTILRLLLGLSASETFDAQTDVAVRAFQTANALGVDGVVGKFTWAKLRSVTAPAERPLLISGATGDAVSWLQKRLGAAPTGVFDATLLALVKAFQTEQALANDGRVGPNTWAALTA